MSARRVPEVVEMSRENVQLVRRVLSEFGATQQVLEGVLAPDWLFDLSTFQGWPGERQFIGTEAFNEFFASWTEPYSEWAQEIEQLRDAGPNQVVATMRQRARLRDTGAWVELSYGLRYTLRDGLIQRIQLYTPPEEALEAAGLL
jgi:ketosteroid isomerase-like protein